MTTLLILVLGYALLTPLEVLLGGRVRRSRRANLGMVLPTMLTAGLAGAALAGVTLYGADHGLGILPWAGISGPTAGVIAFLALDLAGYADHRVRHRVGLLWRVHRAHHTDTEVDVTTSLRNHPLDVAAIVLVSSVVTLAIGAEPWVVALSGTVGAAFGIWDHIRVALPSRFEHAMSGSSRRQGCTGCTTRRTLIRPIRTTASSSVCGTGPSAPSLPRPPVRDRPRHRRPRRPSEPGRDARRSVASDGAAGARRRRGSTGGVIVRRCPDGHASATIRT